MADSAAIPVVLTPAFSPITANDKAGLIWVFAALGLTYCALTLAVRALIKIRRLGADDAVFGIASVSAAVQLLSF